MYYLFSETTLSGCFKHSTMGTCFWTAGQRVDPSRPSTFIWRPTPILTNPCSETEFLMTYTNWDSGEPDNDQSCMMLCSGFTYEWHDLPCSYGICSVCELDIA